MKACLDKALEIVAATPDAFYVSQFSNPHNPKAHYDTTGPEIWDACAGRIDYLVCGVGTGGTISGAGRYLKERNPNIKVNYVFLETDLTDRLCLSGDRSVYTRPVEADTCRHSACAFCACCSRIPQCFTSVFVSLHGFLCLRPSLSVCKKMPFT